MCVCVCGSCYDITLACVDVNISALTSLDFAHPPENLWGRPRMNTGSEFGEGFRYGLCLLTSH